MASRRGWRAILAGAMCLATLGIVRAERVTIPISSVPNGAQLRVVWSKVGGIWVTNGLPMTRVEDPYSGEEQFSADVPFAAGEYYFRILSRDPAGRESVLPTPDWPVYAVADDGKLAHLMLMEAGAPTIPSDLESVCRQGAPMAQVEFAADFTGWKRGWAVLGARQTADYCAYFRVQRPFAYSLWFDGSENSLRPGPDEVREPGPGRLFAVRRFSDDPEAKGTAELLAEEPLRIAAEEAMSPDATVRGDALLRGAMLEQSLGRFDRARQLLAELEVTIGASDTARGEGRLLAAMMILQHDLNRVGGEAAFESILASETDPLIRTRALLGLVKATASPENLGLNSSRLEEALALVRTAPPDNGRFRAEAEVLKLRGWVGISTRDFEMAHRLFSEAHEIAQQLDPPDASFSAELIHQVGLAGDLSEGKAKIGQGAVEAYREATGRDPAPPLRVGAP